jgi:hypothetical protein
MNALSNFIYRVEVTALGLVELSSTSLVKGFAIVRLKFPHYVVPLA